ncbi:MAG: PIG-L family deacetylase [Planctomycetes bacterium]|nr:PIG-L family deacetylase [Planctomycetota bacterium]
MRILHAVHNFPPEFVGGTEAYLAALVVEQAARGHDVVVLAGSERDGDGIVEETYQGIRVLRFTHRGPRFSVHLVVDALRPLWNERLRTFRPDVVHVHHYMNLFAPLAADAKAAGIRTIVSLHDFLTACPRFFMVRPDGGYCGDDTPVPRERCVACCAPEFGGDRERPAAELAARREFFDAELRAADEVLAPSSAAARTLRASGILPRDVAIDVLPLGLTRALHPTPWRPDPLGRLRIAWWGNLAPVKGVDRLVDALERLPPEARARIRLTLLGRTTDAEFERTLLARIAAAAPLELVREGAFDAVRLERLAGETDLAVFFSTAAETYSLVVDEALALGIPVLVADRGAAPERAGNAGFVVPPGDVAALAARLERCLAEPSELAAARAATSARRIGISDHAVALEALYAAPPPSTTAPMSAEPPLPTALPPFDPSFTFVPLAEFSRVPGGRVVVLAPHPDDEVIGAGGALALHARRGDRVAVVHVTDGAGGDRDGNERGRFAQVRKAEARAAGKELGISEFHALDFPDGALRPDGAFLSGFTGLLETLKPDVLYVPSPWEHHPDHRATYWLATRALQRSGLAPRVVLYEVNEPQPASYLVDVTQLLDAKRAALNAFSSQRAYLDVTDKTLTANRARTVNVDVAAVQAAEAYLEIDAARMAEWAELATQVRAVSAAAAAPRAPVAPEVSTPAATRTVPVSCVISTWNKCADVRENLLALTRQTARPAQIVVVDNASKDGTAEMIRREFPQVTLIVMPHDKAGACETFNLGMKAATQPFTAIMDDDVVAPPEWLGKLYDRMLAEPNTTAMVSSLVVEPGMPHDFLLAEKRERYMATFRGCGTLARSDVLKAAQYYDERFFIYGNERDLASRVLRLGHRIVMCPDAELFHKTPFGMKGGKRSLYYHVRNFWLYAFKHCSIGQIVRAAWVLGLKGLGLKRGNANDASGTIGIDKAVKQTPGGLWIAMKATFAALAMLPYCLRHREVCRAPDFEPPVK